MKFESFNHKNTKGQKTPKNNDFLNKKWAESHPEDGIKLEEFRSKNGNHVTQETKDFFSRMYEKDNPGKSLDNTEPVNISEEMESVGGVNIEERVKEEEASKQEDLENPSNKENIVTSFGSIEEIENFLDINSDRLSQDDIDFLEHALKERYEESKEQNLKNENNKEEKQNAITSFRSIKEIEEYLEENSENLLEEDVSFLNNAIEERLASMELPKDVTKEEQSLFVDKGEVSTERLYTIAKKIKTGKVFEDIEIPMYDEHSERIEGFLKNMS